MARRPLSIDVKIKAQEEKVAKVKAKYDKAMEELNALKEQALEEEKAEFFNAFKESGKSIEDLKAFIEAK